MILIIMPFISLGLPILYALIFEKSTNIITEGTAFVYLICSTVIIVAMIIMGAIIWVNYIKAETKTTAETAKSEITKRLTENLNAYKATNDSLASIEKNVNKINENVDNILKEIEKK